MTELCDCFMGNFYRCTLCDAYHEVAYAIMDITRKVTTEDTIKLSKLPDI